MAHSPDTEASFPEHTQLNGLFLGNTQSPHSHADMQWSIFRHAMTHLTHTHARMHTYMHTHTHTHTHTLTEASFSRTYALGTRLDVSRCLNEGYKSISYKEQESLLHYYRLFATNNRKDVNVMLQETRGACSKTAVQACWREDVCIRHWRCLGYVILVVRLYVLAFEDHKYWCFKV